MKPARALRNLSVVSVLIALPGVGCGAADEASLDMHDDVVDEHDHALTSTTGEEPYVHDPNENDEGYDLRDGAEVTWPLDTAWDTTMAELLEVDVIPVISFRTDATQFRSLHPLPLDLVQYDSTMGGWSVRMDLDGLVVTVADHSITTAANVLVARGMQPQGLAVRKTYNKDTAGRMVLGYVELLDAGAPALGALDGFRPSPGGGTAGDMPDCEAQAWAEVAGEGLPNLSIVFPPIAGCNFNDCVETKAAWIRANHDVYRVRQMIEYMNGVSESKRSYLWSQQAKAPDGTQAGERSALSYWFGGYEKYRFDAIRWSFNQLWSDMHDHNLGGLALDLACRPNAGGDLCNTFKPTAHHAVKSDVKLCDAFFDGTGPNTQSSVISHELLHHVFVPWNDISPRLDPIMDTHTHGHGNLCTRSITTDKAYGEAKVRELATYKAGNGNTCWHRNYAFRNNDSYALAAMYIGMYVRNGTSKSWPYDFGSSGGGGGGSSPGSGPCTSGGGGGGLGGGLMLELELTYECPEEY